MSTVEFTLNGQAARLRQLTVAELVREHADDAAAGIAVAINDEVIPRSEWATRHVAEGDRVEIVNAVQGG